MKHLIALICLPILATAADLPLHPSDLEAIQKIATHEGLDAAPEVNPSKGWPNAKGVTAVRFTASAGKKVLLVTHDAQGRVTKLVGNGPLLANEAYEWIAALPELRSIRIDHNIPVPGSAVSLELYDGSGLAALADSKLEEIKIGHALDDDGMAALAKVKSLRIATIGHSRVTDAGVAHLAGHPNLEEFNISPQARPNRVTEKCLPALASLPKLQRLGLHETFLTYDDGLKHLSALKGRLTFVSFKMALVLPDDMEKFKADHPGLKVETSTPVEILANPNARGVERWASPEAVAYLKSGAGK
jgi:hypothetical protein